MKNETRIVKYDTDLKMKPIIFKVLCKNSLTISTSIMLLASSKKGSDTFHAKTRNT